MCSAIGMKSAAKPCARRCQSARWSIGRLGETEAAMLTPIRRPHSSQVQELVDGVDVAGKKGSSPALRALLRCRVRPSLGLMAFAPCWCFPLSMPLRIASCQPAPKSQQALRQQYRRTGGFACLKIAVGLLNIFKREALFDVDFDLAGLDYCKKVVCHGLCGLARAQVGE